MSDDDLVDPAAQEPKDPLAERVGRELEEMDDRDVRDAVDQAIDEYLDDLRALYGEGDR